MSASVTELILYATPTGELAAACDRYFAACAERGPTTAQTYPPHCTLTGFFRRHPARVGVIVGEIQPVIDEAGPVPADAVAVAGLRCTDDWVGFELRSTWLARRTEEVVAAHQLQPGEDALRSKDWLHLSLAYGIDDLDPYRRLALDHGLDRRPIGGWEIGLWERTTTGAWHRLTDSPADPNRSGPDSSGSTLEP